MKGRIKTRITLEMEMEFDADFTSEGVRYVLHDPCEENGQTEFAINTSDLHEVVAEAGEWKRQLSHLATKQALRATLKRVNAMDGDFGLENEQVMVVPNTLKN